MLFTLQRYEFFSKSQHPITLKYNKIRCCLPCKGTNFLANHNVARQQYKGRADVVYLAKVRIFQQITTPWENGVNHCQMLFTLQRYEFFSKSQPAACAWAVLHGCCLPCKGTNFLANHNCLASQCRSRADVVYLAKVRIFQQITTLPKMLQICQQMLFTLQRYEFFSKSQPAASTILGIAGCCLPCKGTNFLANHNAQ